VATTDVYVGLPNEADYDLLDKQLQEAYDQLEDIERGIRLFVKQMNERRAGGEDIRADAPTLTDVGALCSFVISMKTQLHQMRREVEELDEDLERLDCVRLDAAVRPRVS
jgi:hypothetical protein